MPKFPLRKSAADSLLDAYEDKININSTVEVINKIELDLEKKVQKAEKLAINAYSALGATGSTLEAMEADLNNKIKILQNETSKLNGQLLQKSFIDAINEVVAYKYDEQIDYEKFLNYLENQIGKDIDDTEQTWIDISIAAFAEVLGESSNNFIFGSNNQSKNYQYMIHRKTASGKAGKYVGGMLSSNFNDLGEKTAMRISKWMKEHQQQLNNPTVNVSQKRNGVNIMASWQEYPIERFLKMTNENNNERNRFFQNHPGLKYQIQMAYKQKILSQCEVSEKNKRFLNQALSQVIFNRHADSIFGMTGTKLIGVLGEIQALFFTLALTNGKVNSSWVGGIKNPHADLLLTSALGNFGIQVKNTTSEDSRYEVEFQNFNTSIKTIQSNNGTKSKKRNFFAGNNTFEYTNTSSAAQQLDKLFSNNILPNSEGLAEAIETVLGMYTFNVEYQWKPEVIKKYTTKKGKEKVITRRHYFPGKNGEFRPTRKRIVELSNKAQQIMSLFSAAMMYMQNNNTSNGNSNTLYLIGGSTLISAASILKQIVKEMKEELEYEKRSFKVNMNTTSSLEGDNFNITDVFNGLKDVSLMHFSLQSSYTFIRN